MSPKLVFVCWGNICRSPMAEYMARHEAERRGLDLEIVSSGVSTEELGNPMDARGIDVLREAGYPAESRRARQVTADEITSATMVVAAEQRHIDMMRRLVPDATNMRLISDWIPGARPGDILPDPWYGDRSDFVETLKALEHAVPAILDELTQS